MEKEIETEIQKLILSGRKMLAIKCYRDNTNEGLNESRKAIEMIEKSLKTKYPEAFITEKESGIGVKSINSQYSFEYVLHNISDSIVVIEFQNQKMGWSAKIAYNENIYIVNSHRLEITVNQVLTNEIYKEIKVNRVIDEMCESEIINLYMRKIISG